LAGRREDDLLKKWFEELVINPNPVISSLCYSILRIEPYSTCPHACTYCFRRWAAETRKNLINTGQIKAFCRIADFIAARGIKTIPFRISTLCDPFSEPERRFKMTLKLLRVARNKRIPIILSTKSNLVAEDPWIYEIEQLSQMGLVAVQFTLITLEESLSKKLEPMAPLPSERLDAMERLHKKGVPIILRLQPIIPGLNDSSNSLLEVIMEAKASGAERVIIECLRVKIGDSFSREIGLDENCLVPYYGSKHLLGIGFPYMKRISESVRTIVDACGMSFSGCKETLFPLYTAKNCCGIDLLKNACIRITFREIFRKAKGIEDLEGLLAELSRDERFIESHLDDLPRPIARKIRAHQKVLKRTIGSETTRSHFFPILQS